MLIIVQPKLKYDKYEYRILQGSFHDVHKGIQNYHKITQILKLVWVSPIILKTNYTNLITEFTNMHNILVSIHTNSSLHNPIKLKLILLISFVLFVKQKCYVSFLSHLISQETTEKSRTLIDKTKKFN